MSPDYALIYAKLVRHVAAADALLSSNRSYEAGEELSAAMRAIEAFEATFATAHFTIKTDDNRPPDYTNSQTVSGVDRIQRC